MLFVLVKAGDDVVAKEAYGGDDEANALLIADKEAKDPALKHELVDAETFNAATIASVPSEEQTDWQTEKAKGSGAAIVFIAKKLGLE